jgi:hypothetical protein
VRLTGVLVTLAVLCLPPALAAAKPAAPTSPDQPTTDGCQRNANGVVFLKTPEWVYVYRSPTLRSASGIVRVSHLARDDAPGEHRSHDYNANLVPGAADRYVLGGDRAAKTGNFSGEGEELGRLHFEWESGVVPDFAWPTDGDRATLWGSWIWDCGHWTGDGGAITGERTEFHPLTAMAVSRRAPFEPRTTQSQTDVFISSHGTGARAVEQCALSRKPISSTEYGPDYRACVQRDQRANIVHDAPQPVAGKYSFFVPAPPRPSRGARLTYRIAKRVAHSVGTERVRVTRTGLAVTVTVAGRPTEAKPLRYGKSFFASWTGAQRTRPTSLKVTFGTLTINRADPNRTDPPDPAGGKWNLYIDLNGYRQLLNHWIPGLKSVTDGRRLPINRTVRVNVPAGRSLNLLVSGRECDIPSGKVVFGEYAPVVAPCPVNTDEPQIALANDDPGLILDIFRSARAALGSHTSSSVATTNKFPGSPPISFGDGKQGDGDYTLTYTIRPG